MIQFFLRTSASTVKIKNILTQYLHYSALLLSLDSFFSSGSRIQVFESLPEMEHSSLRRKTVIKLALTMIDKLETGSAKHLQSYS